MVPASAVQKFPDALTDVALLKVNIPADLEVLTFGDSDALKQGMKIIAVGNPAGLDMTFTSGIVSAVKRADIGLWPIESFVQVDAAINPGNSGGPLLDQNGSVVGINDAGIVSRPGLNFAIPSKLAGSVIDILRQGSKPNHPFLGVTVLALDQKTKDAYGIDSPVTEGALVMGVASGSGAVSGIRFRDIITHVAGKAVIEPQDLRAILADKTAGDTVAVELIRGGERSSISVTAGTHPGIPLFDPATFCRVYLGFDIAKTNLNGIDRFVVGRIYRSENAQSGSSIKTDAVIWKVAPGSPSGIFEDVIDEEQLAYAFSESIFENDRIVSLEFIFKRAPDDAGGVRVRVSGPTVRNSF